MIFTKSALGRSVPYFDRSLQYEDRILKILYDFRTGPFNAESVFLSVDAIAMYARLSTLEVEEPLGSLLKKNLVEQDPNPRAYRISTEGLIFVQNLPRAA